MKAYPTLHLRFIFINRYYYLVVGHVHEIVLVFEALVDFLDEVMNGVVARDVLHHQRGALIVEDLYW
jgi:hypothetical protein